MNRTTRWVRELRARAISETLFTERQLKRAIHRLGFVQADPIRAPARAQDLILRHRVEGYRAGDLERRYAALEIEEDLLHAYGFVSRPLFRLLHPRRVTGLGALEKKVLAEIRRSGPIHPNELASRLGHERVINAWGGHSKATKQALERLHYRGLLRIARRENGIRIYELAPALPEPRTSRERYRELVLAIARLLAPVPEQTLRAVLSLVRRHLPELGAHSNVLASLVQSGELVKQSGDGLTYLFPLPRGEIEGAPRRVRFLAPFDPLVWDRRRFEHLWRWPYRFEAYTPAARRLRGYYALPLLWMDAVVGWVNARVVQGELDVELGFVEGRPREPAFRRELDAEIEGLRAFLALS